MKNILITTIVAVVFVGCAHSPQSNSKKFKSLNKSVHKISNGVPVESGVPVLLQHQATRQCLLGDPRQVEYTEFGAEHEVVCHTIASTKIVSSLSGREAKGSSIVTVPLEQPENHWIVVKED